MTLYWGLPAFSRGRVANVWILWMAEKAALGAAVI